MKKALIAAGLITVTAGLLAFKLHSSGTFKLPDSVVALTPWGTKPTPLKREFPSHANDVQAEHLAADDQSSTEGAIPAEGATTGTDVTSPSAAGAGDVSGAMSASGVAGAASAGAPASGAEGANSLSAESLLGPIENVESRVARAAELSKLLTNEVPAPTNRAAATPVTKTTATGTAAYAGEWEGDFLGPDAGTVSVTIAPDGTARGHGVSAMTSIAFDLTGKVQSNGKVELTKAAAGVTSTGVVFHGALSNAGQGSGTWTVPSYDISGTWRIHEKSAE